MASDKMRAALYLAKLAVAAAVGYGIAYLWSDTRGGLDEWYVPYAVGVVCTVMVFLLLSKLNKGSGD